jgi:hypothetical protein
MLSGETALRLKRCGVADNFGVTQRWDADEALKRCVESLS